MYFEKVYLNERKVYVIGEYFSVSISFCKKKVNKHIMSLSYIISSCDYSRRVFSISWKCSRVFIHPKLCLPFINRWRRWCNCTRLVFIWVGENCIIPIIVDGHKQPIQMLQGKILHFYHYSIIFTKEFCNRNDSVMIFPPKFRTVLNMSRGKTRKTKTYAAQR